MPRSSADSCTHRRVLLCQSWWIDAVLTGVARYAKEQRWVLNCDMKWSHRVPQNAGEFDGMIISGDDPALLNLARSARVPVVRYLGEHDRRDGFQVACPDQLIGALAADHLLAKGFTRLGFVTFSGEKNPGSRLGFAEFPKSRTEELRCEGYRKKICESGAQFESIPINRLRKRLQALPRPMGLMAFNDSLALDVLRVLQEEHCAVPEEFAVIGAGDTEVLCDFAPVPLSSVNCDHERRGYEAAAMLDRLMSGKTPAKKIKIVPPKGVTMRRSTDMMAVADLTTARALRFLRDHYREPLVMDDVARHVGVPLWRLQKSFRAHIGSSLLGELTRLRVEAAKRVLGEPKTKIEAVAGLCGFYSRFHFHRTFSRVAGVSPMVWRQAARREASPVVADAQRANRG